MTTTRLAVEVHAPEGTVRRVAVGGPVAVGRAGDGLVLDDERCSREHCELRPVGDMLVVEDRGSTNGTYVNRERVAAPTAVGQGDEILVGSTRLVVIVEEDDRAAAELADQLRASIVGDTLTIVFSDIVDSTAMAVALGDREWCERLECHDALVRSLVAGHSGIEVKHRGDGFMLTFPSARLGVLFALAFQAALAEARADGSFALHVRIGVHTGEVIHRDGDLFGTHVHVASRIAEAAAADEVLVSRLVRELVSPMGDLAFGADREVTLKGLPSPALVAPVALSDGARPRPGDGPGAA